jgi:hypothetical protein
MASAPGTDGAETIRELPAFRFESPSGTDLLWGVTYRIVMSFLTCCFSFVPPALENLPPIEGRLARNYLTGERVL